MGHISDFFVVDRKEDVLPRAENFAFYNVDREENPSGSYHGNMSFLSGICDTEEEARRLIDEKANRGFYSDYAIRFKCADKFTIPKSVERLMERASKLQKEFEDYKARTQVAVARTSKLITCENCGSKLAREYLNKNHSRCPVCDEDLRAEYIRKRIKKYRNDIDALQKSYYEQVEALQKKANQKSDKVKWLMKVEVHC